MATKLKDITFGDDLLKGSANSNSGVDYTFGGYDRIIEVDGLGGNTVMEYNGSVGWLFHGYADGIDLGSGNTWTPSYDSGTLYIKGYATGIDGGSGHRWYPSYDYDSSGWSLNGYADGIDGGCGNTWSPSYDSAVGNWSLPGYAIGLGNQEGYLNFTSSSGWIYLRGSYGGAEYTIVESYLGSSSTPQFQAPSLAVKYIFAGPQGSESFYELSVDDSGFVKAALPQ